MIRLYEINGQPVTAEEFAIAALPVLATLHARIAAVEALHVRREQTIYDGADDCPVECDHPEGTCIVLATAVCAHCADQTEPDEPWEHWVREMAFWPCDTRKALDTAGAHTLATVRADAARDVAFGAGVEDTDYREFYIDDDAEAVGDDHA